MQELLTAQRLTICRCFWRYVWRNSGMTPKNLWGQLPPTEEIRTPTQIIKEQASALADLTRGTLQGSVSVRATSDQFVINLDIVAPAIDNYTYNVLEALHSLQLY